MKMHHDNIEKKKKYDVNVEELEEKKRIYEELRAKFEAMNLVGQNLKN